MKNKKTIIILVILILVWVISQRFFKKPVETPDMNVEQTSEMTAEENMLDQEVQLTVEEQAQFDAEIKKLEELAF